MIVMKFVYSSKALCWIYCKISQLRYPEFKKEVERRAKLDLFDYKGIAQPLPKCYYEINTDNNCFGIGWSLRQYTGVKKEYCNAMVEHGYFFGRYVQDMEKVTFSNRLLTFGDIRKAHIEAVVKNKVVIPIGPYIHYAPDYYNEYQLKKEKDDLGRVLLVFFSHSGTGCSVSFDVDYIVSKINSVKNDFDTVVVSLFWSDINDEIEKRLNEEGYKIFSAGHRYDYYFLSRLKTMIKLSDMTMSNFVGTHIGYCTYLGKGHWIVKQEITEKALTGKGAGIVALDEQMAQDPDNQKEMNDFYESFADYSLKQTEEQHYVAARYYGFEHIKSEKGIKAIIE